MAEIENQLELEIKNNVQTTTETSPTSEIQSTVSNESNKKKTAKEIRNDGTMLYGKDKKYPIKFDPTENFNAEDWEKIAVQDAKMNVKVRLARAFVVICFPLALLFLLTEITKEERFGSNKVICGDPTKNHLTVFIGIAVWSMYIFYFILIFYLFSTGTRKQRALYRIYSVSTQAPSWTKMNISSHQLLFPNKAITSISEFSAIYGGVPNIMLATLSAYTWAVVMMHFAVELTWNVDFAWDVADAFEITGVIGLILIGIFEIDPFNNCMQGMHYLGAILGTGTIGGYVIQQWSLNSQNNRLWLSIVIAVIAGIAFVFWRYFHCAAEKYENLHENDDQESLKKDISCYSLKNVVSEAIFLFLGASSLALWLIEYEQYCDHGCCCHAKV